MAGVGVPPVPAKKPDILRPVSYSPEIPASTTSKVPLPPVKPRRGDVVAAAITEDMDAMAATLGMIEPAAFGPADARVPVPVAKPDFAEPDVAMLLKFGQPPVPRAKPVTQSTAPMSDRDAALYRQIFAAQTAGDFDTADGQIGQLSDARLRGHVLFQRYMHPKYRAGFYELQSWLDMYSDHPGADRIYRLASSRKPASFKGPIKAARNQIGIGAGTLHTASAGDSYATDRKRSSVQSREINRLVKVVHDDISHGAPTRALKRLSNDSAAKLMDAAEYDQLRGQIANGYLLMGKPGDARKLAEASIKRSGEKAPMAGWAGGLAAWKQKDYKGAARYFETTARSPYVNSWLKSAAAYWASRAHMRAGNTKQVSYWLKESASHPRTFYGMVATRALGWDFNFDWSAPEFTKAQSAKLASIPAASRAMALVQAGQNHLAEAEMLQIAPGQDEALKESLLAYTQKVNLPGLSMRLANNMARPDGGLYDAALYPMLPWEPKNGYSIDRALIHAIIRQESKFNTWAESTKGATGLMQVMPATAHYIAGGNDAKDNDRLKDPVTNLEIGQKYVRHLLDQDGVGNDLLSMAIAYNAGPGNLRKWKREMADIQNDPLLFIEMIPMAETRNYVERVLANYWIYAMRMNQPLPSLDSVAEGKWATYVPADDHGATVRLTAVLNPFRVAAN